MQKILITILTLMFCITLISATTIYSGESIEITLDKPYSYYSIVGNSTEVILDIIQVGNNVTIIPDEYSELDSYEIVFFDKEKETITVYQSSGGGGGSSRGSRTIYRDKNVTQFVDREVEIEVPGENIEVEKIVKSKTWPLWLGMIVLALIIGGLIFFKKDEDITERRLETYEQENSNTSNDDFDNQSSSSS